MDYFLTVLVFVILGFLILYLLGMGWKIWIILIAAIPCCVYTVLVNMYYQKHDYYRRKQFCLRTFSIAFFATFIVLAVYCFLLIPSIPPTSIMDVVSYVITSTLIAIVISAILYVSEVRHAKDNDQSTRKIAETIIQYVDEISSWADYAIFYVDVEGSGEHSTAYIKASTGNETDKICRGNAVGLERFGSYMKEHYPNCVSVSTHSVSIRFPLH